MRVWRLGIIIAGLLIVCVVVTTACGVDQGSEEDKAAKWLVRRAMITLDNFYLAIGSCDVDWHYLSDVESRLVFKQARQHVAGVGIQPSVATAGQAAEHTVTYFGDSHSYSIVTVSESGTLWGVYADKTSGENRYFCSVRDGVLSEGW